MSKTPGKKIVAPFVISLGKRIERRHFTEPPIYIGGCGRSGTTLLLSILSAHRDIFACPGELNLFFDAYEKEGIVHIPMIYRLYRTFLTQRIKSTAVRYCEKSPANVQRIVEIDKYHDGNFRLIHIIRDGRDVVLSKHPKRPDEYWVEPERWVKDVSLGLSFRDHPKVMTIHYESLITNFKKTIGEVCSFLEIDTTPEILAWHRYTTVRKNRALYSDIGEINTSSIGKHRLPVNEDRLSAFMRNRGAVDLLNKLGYQ